MDVAPPVTGYSKCSGSFTNQDAEILKKECTQLKYDAFELWVVVVPSADVA